MTVVLVPLVLAWVDPPSAGRLPAAGERSEPAGAETAAQWSKRAALRSWRFWSVTAPFALAFTSQVGFIVHQVAFLSPSLGPSGAGTAVAIMTSMAVIGRLVLGLRHAAINRTDIGTYSVERFKAMTGCKYEVATGVREAECLALRRQWGKDSVAR